MRADSQLPAFRRLVERQGPFDLVLIDGDHSEEGCQNDLYLLKPHASIIVLHDIVSTMCPGVPAVWQRFRDSEADDWTFHEFTDQYDDALARTGSTYLGIGMAVRRDRAPTRA